MVRKMFEKGNEKDYIELTAEEFIKSNIPLPETPDTEDGKYVLISMRGALKLGGGFIKYLDNNLWYNFAECIESKRDKYNKFTFKYKAKFIEILLKLKLHKEFKNYIQIIDYATNNLEKIIHIRQNFDKFISLCKLYGRIYGVYETYEYDKEDEKDGEKNKLNFMFHVLLNPQNLKKQKGIKMSVNEFQNKYPKLIKRFEAETGQHVIWGNKITVQFKQWLQYQKKIKQNRT